MIRECPDLLIVWIQDLDLLDSLCWSFVTIRVGRVEMEISE